MNDFLFRELRDPVEDVPAWAQQLNHNLIAVADSLATIEGTVTTVGEQVKPAIDALSKSPIFKMLGGK